MGERFSEATFDHSLTELEGGVRDHWEREDIFRRSIEERPADNTFTFNDGPPFATGLPHYGHILPGAIKDAIPRYQTMQGHRVPRTWGWDCHGLPIEALVQEELGLDGRQAILDHGIGEFSDACRAAVLRHVDEWKHTQALLGRWVDMEDPYMTMDVEYIESVWWVFEQLYEKGLIYEGQKVVAYSPGLSSPLSNFEAGLNYKDIEDTAVTIAFELEGEPDTKLLAWTTTPWTLFANLGLAVASQMEYVKVRRGDQNYILADASLVDVMGDAGDYEVLKRFKGEELVGKQYKPLFPHFADKVADGSFRIVASDHVVSGDGSGIVHMAPAYGEEDFLVGQEMGLGLVDPIDEDGIFTAEIPELEGVKFRDANAAVLDMLRESGVLFAEETITHSYPHCWRTEEPLMYKAIPTWYVAVTKIRDELVARNQETEWVPTHLRDGRFGKWLEGARDWAISRNRFWGAPLPIWRCEETGEIKVIGSKEELETLSGQEVTDLHKAHIDDVEVVIDGKTYRRVPEIFDCWFESGSMPYAAIHHPFEGDGKLDETFPADFIAEGIDQTRGWFYTLMVLSTALFDQPAFRNVIVNGIVLAEDGEKMSKSKKNYPDPNEIMERIGADALRFYLLASPAAKGESLKFSEEGVDQVVKKLLLPLRNIHKFFVTYANADEWEPEEGLVGEIHEGTREKPEGELDRWILAKLEEVQTEVTAAFDAYDMPRVTQALVGFIEDLSNWYVRLSRKRFWRSASDADKDSAYKTLFEVLIRYSQMLAPVVPFIAETTYRELTGEDSVHLSNWPKENKGYADPEILKEMAEVRTLVTGGLALRNKERIRVRQPLSEICVVRDGRLPDLEGAFVDLIKAELNVKDLRVIEPDDPEVFIPEIKLEFGVIGRKFREKVKLIQQAISAGDYSLSDGRLAVAGETLVEGTDYTLERKPNENFAVSQEGGYTLALKIHITDELKAEGVARDLIRAVQETRKEADLRVSDRIMLEVSGEGIEGIIREHRATIIGEVLADQLVDHLDDPDLAKDVVIQGYEVRVALKKIVPLESS